MGLSQLRNVAARIVRGNVVPIFDLELVLPTWKNIQQVSEIPFGTEALGLFSKHCPTIENIAMDVTVLYISCFNKSLGY
jgi:hypothetical protein